MSTSIYISKIITKIESNNFYAKVTNHKFSELNSLISNLDSFEFKGVIMEKKFNKYHLQLLNNGFMIDNVIHNHPMNFGAIDFKIIYKKCI